MDIKRVLSSMRLAWPHFDRWTIAKILGTDAETLRRIEYGHLSPPAELRQGIEDLGRRWGRFV